MAFIDAYLAEAFRDFTVYEGHETETWDMESRTPETSTDVFFDRDESSNSKFERDRSNVILLDFQNHSFLDSEQTVSFSCSGSEDIENKNAF